jgi:hypothetical protein
MSRVPALSVGVPGAGACALNTRGFAVIDWLPEWLFEGQLTVYAVLAVVLIVTLIVWKQTPRTAYLVCCLALVALIGLYWLLDYSRETDREQITHAIQEMSAGVQSSDVNRIFDNISETYNRHGMNKAAFRQVSAGVITSSIVDQLVVYSWDFPPDYKQKESASDERENVAKVSFMAKPVGRQGTNLYLIEAVMHRDSDGKWRLQTWEARDPFHNGGPLQVPYLDGQ